MSDCFGGRYSAAQELKKDYGKLSVKLLIRIAGQISPSHSQDSRYIMGRRKTDMTQPECPHDVIEKFVTKHGLVCEKCLTEADFKAYPGWKKRLETKDLGRAAQV
jgi:hypothetical protein